MGAVDTYYTQVICNFLNSKHHLYMSKYTLSQIRILDDLLALGSARPYSKTSEASELLEYINKGIGNSFFDWKGGKVYFTKSLLKLNDSCQVSFLADMEKKSDRFSIPTVVGTVVHKAIQISYTHPNKSTADLVSEAIKSTRVANQLFDEWYSTQDIGTQSEIIALSGSKFLSFLDDWPKFDPTWSPRFEEPIISKFKDFTLSARPDLILGRPHTDFKRTMMVIDFKTSQIRDEHRDEALFYALVSTLRYGVMPWRSTVYSLSSGDWTNPDFEISELFAISDKIITSLNLYRTLLSESAEPVFKPGDQCTWCSLKSTCKNKI
jgi:hypothetical protein